MPFIVAGVIWLFTTVIDTTDSLHTLEAKVDTFNTLSAEKVQIQIKNMEGDLTELKTSFKELNKKLGKDQEEIMKLLIKINGNK
jgi:TolA-binding protein